ncbi:MAG: uracil-DNA glycosylase [Ruminococcaceae bacterium]|nr:uracil-DNA glycosylase [Oscillospiraceae bacterium]
MRELFKQCNACKGCELYRSRTNLVFGVGNEKADIIFVGEAPGEQEDLLAEPFVGRSGKFLDEMLREIGLTREDIYIANIIKCRPPQNRDPKPSEQDACIHWLEKQIEIIDPKVIVCLGRIPATRFIDKDFKVTKQHGELIQKNGRIYMGTFHPAAILRNMNNKILMQGDLAKLKEIKL